jgi:hypothetical protein
MAHGLQSHRKYIEMKAVQRQIVVDPLTCEYPVPGLVIERSADQQLCIFMMNDGRPATLNAWNTCTFNVLRNWPQGQPCLLLHDLHRAGFWTSSREMLGKFKELYQFRPELARLVAIVLPTNWGVDLIAQLDIKLRALLAPSGYPIHWEVFTKRDYALHWLVHTDLSQASTFSHQS